jgi:hypothetical protein
MGRWLTTTLRHSRANPPASDVDLLLFSLRNIFHQLYGGTPLFQPRSPRGWSHFGLTNTMNVYTRELRRALTQPPPMTEFVGMMGYGSASFHDFFSDDDLLSEGSTCWRRPGRWPWSARLVTIKPVTPGF